MKSPEFTRHPEAFREENAGGWQGQRSQAPAHVIDHLGDSIYYVMSCHFKQKAYLFENDMYLQSSSVMEIEVSMHKL